MHSWQYLNLTSLPDRGSNIKGRPFVVALFLSVGKKKFFLQRLRRIHCIPPGWVILQPFGEPCKDGVLPLNPLVVIQYVVVLVFHKHHGGLFAKEFEGGVHLDALANRNVVVLVSVKEQDRGVYLVGVVQRALLHVKIPVAPRIAVGH